ncbi:tubby C-terminal domain-like protein [Sediminibacillus albus]|uniref:Tubby C-terminal domain-containing protein n=1 Tax=Sediminibacillus albus TaxID=407036 RepID=A0A1G9A3B1_9BACI|nr:hypothetical protein [Sediminibacillus albus]SDK21816.1 hypothetical protein SAMN05216243_2390 [Sediminibacillus albus]
MKVYTFKRPFINKSQKEFAVYDHIGKEAGVMQRYFKSNIQLATSAVINVSNVKVKDVHNHVSMDIKEKGILQNLLFNKWDIVYRVDNEEHKFELHDKTKIQTNVKMIYSIGDRHVTVKDEIGDKTVRFFNSDNKIFAEASYKSLIPPIEYEVKIFDENVHFCEISGIYFLLLLHKAD